MSAYIGIRPTLRDLVVALREVDWHQLGTQLGVPPEELKKIDEECHDISRKLNETLSYWLKNEEPSWEKITEALERMGHHGNLVIELRSKYCSVPLNLLGSLTSSIVPVTYTCINGKQKKHLKVIHNYFGESECFNLAHSCIIK